MNGRAWVFGDEIDTDLLAPGLYMKGPLEELAKHCLEGADPAFAAAVRPGDYVVAGRNFGMGSSREQAAEVLRLLGVRAVIARSFAGIFYRNAFNLGLAAVVCPEVAAIRPSDTLALDLGSGRLTNDTSGRVLACEPVPDHLLTLLADGGLLSQLEKRLKRSSS